MAATHERSSRTAELVRGHHHHPTRKERKSRQPRHHAPAGQARVVAVVEPSKRSPISRRNRSIFSSMRRSLCSMRSSSRCPTG